MNYILCNNKEMAAEICINLIENGYNYTILNVDIKAMDNEDFYASLINMKNEKVVVVYVKGA